MIHIAMTLDETYVAPLPEYSPSSNTPPIWKTASSTSSSSTSTFPYLSFHLYLFDSNLVKGKISYSI
ncbi:hypothetical protein SO802_008097 [Lithocarpus litseifolius]|uniref:Uncharacterized protein n=1 Tax=Lithocarpus litseifolius TaxID=425828 RepID=A0AAW2DBJ1_9ROSI